MEELSRGARMKYLNAAWYGLCIFCLVAVTVAAAGCGERHQDQPGAIRVYCNIISKTESGEKQLWQGLHSTAVRLHSDVS